MKIIKAEHLGMCFGVRDAIALARKEAARQPVTILGPLVHNPTVLQRLHAEGVEFADNASEVRTPTAIITAHGGKLWAANNPERGATFHVTLPVATKVYP